MAARVSVVMSVFNGQRYLAQAVQSLLGQTFTDFELIVIDDGSTDETPNLLERLAAKDARIRVVSHENCGLTRSLNKGIRLGKGEFIARMDADDVSLPDRLARQVEFMEARPEVVAAGGQILVIDEDDDPIAFGANPEEHDELVAMIRRGATPIVHPTAMVRADALRRVGGYDERFRVAQDFDLWLRLSEIGELANLSQVLLVYRSHERSVTGRSRDLQREAVLLSFQAACHRSGSSHTCIPDQKPWPQKAGANRWCDTALTALAYGFPLTSRKYAWKAFLSSPLAWRSWVLFCSSLFGAVTGPVARWYTGVELPQSCRCSAPREAVGTSCEGLLGVLNRSFYAPCVDRSVGGDLRDPPG
jgi:glycosyltransferase involved in cell wall biosynthesis